MTCNVTSLCVLATCIGLSCLTHSAEATESTIGYEVPPGTCSNAIAVPANKPVMLRASQDGEFVGVGQLTFLHATKYPESLSWVGISYYFPVLLRGSSTTPGTHIMTIGAPAVEIRVAGSFHIAVCNPSNTGYDAEGYLTFTY